MHPEEYYDDDEAIVVFIIFCSLEVRQRRELHKDSIFSRGSMWPYFYTKPASSAAEQVQKRRDRLGASSRSLQQHLNPHLEAFVAFRSCFGLHYK